MKKIDFKKFGVLVLLLLFIGGGIIFIINANKNNTKEIKLDDNIKKFTLNIVKNLKEGYLTSYDGVELLYNEKSVSWKDLTKGNKLNAARNYIFTYNLDTSVSDDIYTLVKKNNNYDSDDYILLPGKSIREAIKNISGEKFNDSSSRNEFNFIYDFIYISEYDVYLFTVNNNYMEHDNNSSVLMEITSSKENKKSIILDVVVYYAYNNNGKYIYYDDSTMKNELFKEDKLIEKLDKKYLSKLKKYQITYKKDGKNYFFDNIKKL